MIELLPSTLEPVPAVTRRHCIEFVDLTKPEPPTDHWLAVAFAVGMTAGALRRLFIALSTACKSAQ